MTQIPKIEKEDMMVVLHKSYKFRTKIENKKILNMKELMVYISSAPWRQKAFDKVGRVAQMEDENFRRLLDLLVEDYLEVDFLIDRYYKGRISRADTKFFYIEEYAWAREFSTVEGDTYELLQEDSGVCFSEAQAWPGRSYYSQQGRRDVPLQYLFMDFDETSIKGVREKKDGVRFENYVNEREVGKKTHIFGGDYALEVPSDFPVQAAERVGDVFYILYPYGLSSFCYVHPDTKEVLIFRSHPWLSYKDDSYIEGWILLIGDEEFRLKRNPTIEVKVECGKFQHKAIIDCPLKSGVAEVCLQGENLYFVKWRPGKKPHTHPFNYLLQAPFGDMWNPVAAKHHYVKKNDEKMNVHLVRSYAAFFGMEAAESDSFYYVYNEKESQKATLTIPKAKIDRDQFDLIVEVWNRHNRCIKDYCLGDPVQGVSFGSKIAFISRSDVYVIAEGNKGYDLPGGKIEPGETPIEALHRELDEELKVRIKGPVLWTVSCAKEGDDIFFTFLFHTNSPQKLPLEGKWISVAMKPENIPIPVVSWLSRHLSQIRFIIPWQTSFWWDYPHVLEESDRNEKDVTVVSPTVTNVEEVKALQNKKVKYTSDRQKKRKNKILCTVCELTPLQSRNNKKHCHKCRAINRW